MSSHIPNDESQFYSELLRAFFDSTNDAIFVLCDEMKFLISNKMTEQWLGYSEQTLTEHNKRTPITELLGSQDDIQLFKDSFDRALKCEDVFFEAHISPLKGKARWVEFSMKRVDIENSDMIITVARDITERKIAESEKERLQRELSQSQKMDALGQLTGGIAHDFNNILSIIGGYAELAIHRQQDQNKDIPISRLNIIQESTERAKNLIAQLMVFSRIDNVECQPMQLACLIEEDIKMLRATMPSSIEFNLNYDDNLPDVMMAPVNLQQLLINLCINAKDAMNGVGKINISLKLNQSIHAECSSCHKQISGTWVELVVSDTGSGITQDIISRIFDPFFTTKSVGKGTGMGLAMVGSIMEGYAGHIVVKTEAEIGTSIHMLFPVAKVEQTILNKSLATNTYTTENVSSNIKSILIVDDEPDLACLLSDMLKARGFKCQYETSSLKALEIYLSSPDDFDLVITDQTMPDMTGDKLINKIREVRPHQAIILASGYSDVMNAKIAAESGIIFMQKPIASCALIDAINGIFS